MRLPDLGVGLVYWPALRALVDEVDSVVDVLELEPQTSWIAPTQATEPFRVDRSALDDVAAIERPKLIHSVGLPVGETRPADERQLPALRETVDRLAAPWVSEHLSFMRAGEGAASFSTGFLLPPRQTDDGIRTVTRRIAELGTELGVPIAIETGVNYLRSREDELPDGDFTAAVVAGASCGLLLDLHNVWCNARNGRQPVDRFLASLPLDRVWEIHVAGGRELDGYWLDAHCGTAPEAVMALAREVVPSLPNLRAIVLEVLPEYVPLVGTAAIRAQLDELHDVWGRRPPPERQSHSRWSAPERRGQALRGSAVDWERVLGSLVAGVSCDASLVLGLQDDGGVRLYQTLVNEARAGTVAAILPLTTRLLLFEIGADAVRELLRDFAVTRPPDLVASAEAAAFAAHLGARRVAVRHLSSVLAFELAIVRRQQDGRGARIDFDVEPVTLLSALAEGRAIGEFSPSEVRYEVVLDDVPVVDSARVS